ncbi:MSHA biogenesis protein MshA [Vibrio sp. qd031]|uniref:type II secretion system protein n=1 Tax=Vibrio sp. qd031 TaxID=1603038 RepID=UPI000A106118|nr:type II secretion system protein [Vibrio sp. qd031]ORT52021.1 MSHA biogenesis protein MshA [Vibrio sp. qd031]
MKQKGFTLIELVVVIVILGILAVTAAPRFLNLQSDARESALQGLKGAMAGASSIVYAKSAIQGDEALSSATITDSSVGDITVAFGYPTATLAGIGAAVEGLGDDWQPIAITGDTGISYSFDGQDSTGYTNTEGCHVRYDEATSSNIYSVSVITTKC